MMPFRNRGANKRSVVKKNDGLPIVNGRKVQRRDGGDHADYNNSKEKGHWMNNNNMLLVMVLFVMTLIVKQNGGDSSSPEVVVVSTGELAAAKATSNVEMKPAVVAVTTTSTTATPKFAPDQCTSEQLKKMEKQLPDSDWCSKYWTNKCSFRVATGGCQNPVLARDFFASKDQPFLGMVLGWGGNDVPIDMLHAGSGLNPKYNSKEWNKLIGKTDSCRTPIATTTRGVGEKARVLAIDWDPVAGKIVPTLEELKTKLSLTDIELLVHAISRTQITKNNFEGKHDLITRLFRQTFPSPTEPIHYMDMTRGEGLDYTILTELLPTLLKQVRFLKFELNKSDSWSNQSLKEVITTLKKENGLICYWSGSDPDNSLWRITDCFLDHFDKPQYARISCVSSIHDDVKELALKMENGFLQKIK